MKKSLTPIIFCLMMAITVYGQHCIPSAIVFTTQVQVDNFPTDYPGCTIIDGNVGITGNDITNLDGLTQITQIGGSVQIINMNSLNNIDGLNSLTHIGWHQ